MASASPDFKKRNAHANHDTTLQADVEPWTRAGNAPTELNHDKGARVLYYILALLIHGLVDKKHPAHCILSWCNLNMSHICPSSTYRNAEVSMMTWGISIESTWNFIQSNRVFSSAWLKLPVSFDRIRSEAS
jgi:hypothetical protein